MHAQTLPAMLMDQAARQGARAWVQAPGGTLEYGEAPAHAARWAALLAAHGVRRGDRVALMAGNRIEFLSVVLGCGWLGAVAVPINTASRGMQLRHILENSACVLLVADAASCAGLATVDGDGLALREIWLLDGDAPPAGLALPAPARVVPAAPPEGVEPADLGPGDMLAILYTSGTSGLSKGVCCPHAQFWWWGLIAARNLEIRGEDVLYTSLPLFHTNALNACFQALVTGASIVCDERFSVSRYFDRLEQTGATVTYLLGAMVPMLLAREPAPAERRHRARIALAPGVPERFHGEFLRRTGLALLEGYGSTETNFALAGCWPSSARAPWAGSRPSSRPAWPTSTTRRCRTASPASCCCGRARLTPSPPATSPWRTRRSRPGATCGSTPATGWCATPTATTASWTA